MSRTSIRLTDAREQRYVADLKNKRELMSRLADGERLSPNEIAGILSTPEVPIRFEASADVGPEK
jgi:DNA-binding GntR family transcriptional regulator